MMTHFGCFLTVIIGNRKESILSPNQNRKILIRRLLKVFLRKVPKTFLFLQKERFPDVSLKPFIVKCIENEYSILFWGDFSSIA
ncbi:MAG: hypothetical protein A2007_04650 [Verrucomicrobia bacterium GWC2_42_7]|nr:MAG: hypothetical protein A2007_04650 [Verrucomicrobia bacterium GWC2_42_7]